MQYLLTALHPSKTQAHTPTCTNLFKNASINDSLVNAAFLKALFCDIRQFYTSPLLQRAKMVLALP